MIFMGWLMAVTSIGSKGLAEVNLTIPQGTSLEFDVSHTDTRGKAIDHTGSTVTMSMQRKDGGATIDLSEYCEGTDGGVSVYIPASVTSVLPLGYMLWDMIVTTDVGGVIRMCYGTVNVVDTYALDGE